MSGRWGSLEKLLGGREGGDSDLRGVREGYIYISSHFDALRPKSPPFLTLTPCHPPVHPPLHAPSIPSPLFHIPILPHLFFHTPPPRSTPLRQLPPP